LQLCFWEGWSKESLGVQFKRNHKGVGEDFRSKTEGRKEEIRLGREGYLL